MSCKENKNRKGMFKFSKKIEYAILAMQFLAKNETELVSAKEMSDKLNIPYEFLSKTLQKLMKSSLIESQQGTKGGYQLSKNSKQITVEEVILAMDEKPGIVDCLNNGEVKHENCSRSGECSIKTPMFHIQGKINEIFKTTTINDLV